MNKRTFAPEDFMRTISGGSKSWRKRPRNPKVKAKLNERSTKVLSTSPVNRKGDPTQCRLRIILITQPGVTHRKGEFVAFATRRLGTFTLHQTATLAPSASRGSGSVRQVPGALVVVKHIATTAAVKTLVPSLIVILQM